MPSPKKVAWSQLKVGIMALVALVILAVLVFLMTGADNPFSEKFILYAFFPDSVAMTDGSAVRLNGILVGKVSRIELTGDANNKRAVRMTMEIEEHFKGNIPKDSEVGYDAENVLGTKYLNIERGQSREHVQTGAEIKSKDEMDVMAMLQSASPLLESMQSILKRVDGLVAQDSKRAREASAGCCTTMRCTGRSTRFWRISRRSRTRSRAAKARWAPCSTTHRCTTRCGVR